MAAYRRRIQARRRQDRLFRIAVRIASLIPVLLLLVMILTLVVRSMAADLGSEARRALHLTGLATAAAGSFWVIASGLAVSAPIALVAALWMAHPTRLSRKDPLLVGVFRTLVRQAVRIPNVVYGVFALALFLRLNALAPALGIRNLGNASILLGIIMLPNLVLMMEQELKDVPDGIDEASFALGASWVAVMVRQVLPAAAGAMGAGILRIAARMIGLASPFIVLGAPSFVSAPPAGFGDRFISLPVQIYQWAVRPESAYRGMAAFTSLVLLLCILLLDVAADTWKRRVVRRREGLR